jgi:hypothetical protein
MKTIRLLVIIQLAFLTAAIAGCKKKNDNTTPLLPHSYSGALSLEYTKGFPQFSVTVTTDVTVSKDRSVTFGSSDSEAYDKEEIKYENGKPAVKIHVSGTLTFHEGKGEYKEISGIAYLWIWVHTSINGQMTLWGWDDDLGWVLALDTPYTYEDEYSDGQMQFPVDDAVLSGASIKKTLPDAEGTFTYGYLLILVVVS